MISPRLFAGLNHLAGLMHEESEPWWIIGSTAMVLSGIDGIEPDDIDVVASGTCLRRVLANVGMTETASKPHPQFRSRPYQRIEFSGMTHDTHRIDGRFRGSNLLENGSSGVRNPLTYPRRRCSRLVPSIAEQIALLRLFGREKDMAKAALLEAYVGQDAP
jgi:hypothetical protein